MACYDDTAHADPYAPAAEEGTPMATRKVLPIPASRVGKPFHARAFSCAVRWNWAGWRWQGAGLVAGRRLVAGWCVHKAPLCVTKL
jgi:hypothetical protein